MYIFCTWGACSITLTIHRFHKDMICFLGNSLDKWFLM